MTNLDLAYPAGVLTILSLCILSFMLFVFARGKRIRQVLGAAVLAGIASIALGLNGDPINSETAVPAGSQPMTVSDALKRPIKSSLPVEGRFPSLDGAVDWLNSPPLTAEQLRGKVVLVDFWAYSCINCIRTIPYVRAWAEKYADQGLVVIGVHAPEFAFEKKVDNVKQAIQDFRIGYPVAIDNDYKIWRAFQNNYWPALYFIDANGQIRHHVFGEGEYEASETVIQDLLREAGDEKAERDMVKPDAGGAEAAPDLGNIRSDESYIGYKQATNFISPQGLSAGTARDYTTTEPRLNEWGLSGNWTVGPEEGTLNRSGGGITYRFSARDLHLVLGPDASGKPVRFQVKIDGKAPGENHGADTDAGGNGTVTKTRLYQLVRQAGGVKERTFEISFLDPGVEAFVFTFG